MAIKCFPHTFSVKKPLKYTYFSRTSEVARFHKSLLYFVTVIINHLVKCYFFSKKSTIHVFSGSSSTCTTYSKGGWEYITLLFWLNSSVNLISKDSS